VNKEIFLFESNGNYVGFISQNGFIFSRNGIYLGWVEGNVAWDVNGRFRGVLTDIKGNNYILINRFMMPPFPKTPQKAPTAVTIPDPPPNIPSIVLPPGLIDSLSSK